eukprot:COSAG01_NODE_6145_length_3825_cov_7.907944_1_plen_67_part_10
MEQAERGEGGLQGLNTAAVGTLRRWFVGYAVELGRRARRRGGEEGAGEALSAGIALMSMGEQEEAIE